MKTSIRTKILAALAPYCLVFSLQAQDVSFDETLQNMRGIIIAEDDRAEAARAATQIDKALRAFLETEFLEKFKEIRLESESMVAAFKAHSGEYTPEDVSKVRKSYVRVADQFNLLLNEIKIDLLDKKKMKVIRDNPDMYSASLELKLRILQDEYAQTFEKTIAEVTGSESYSAIPLAAIIGLVKLAGDFIGYIQRSGFENRKIKEEHLNQFLIEPYKFRNWDEIN